MARDDVKALFDLILAGAFIGVRGMRDWANPPSGKRRCVTWSEEHVAKYEERYPVGSTARLALALYLNLGVRKSDVVRIGPRHIRDGVLHNFLPRKGERTGGKRISVKLFEETRALIAATPVTGTETFLITSFGKPFTANGFGKMREWCDEAGLPDCTSHGLRKLMMIRLVHEGYGATAAGLGGTMASAGFHLIPLGGDDGKSLCFAPGTRAGACRWPSLKTRCGAPGH